MFTMQWANVFLVDLIDTLKVRKLPTGGTPLLSCVVQAHLLGCSVHCKATMVLGLPAIEAIS
jgi:hypothetical protein